MGFEYTIKAIPTEYNGIMFRSRLEATWAAFFETLEWEWDYEPVDFDRWSPDFIIKGGKSTVFCEVKPIDLSGGHTEALDKAYGKVKLPRSMYERYNEEDQYAWDRENHYSESVFGHPFQVSNDAHSNTKKGIYTLALGISPFEVVSEGWAAIGIFIEGEVGEACLTRGFTKDFRSPIKFREVGLTSAEGVWGDILSRVPIHEHARAHKEAFNGILEHRRVLSAWHKAKNLTQKQYA